MPVIKFFLGKYLTAIELVVLALLLAGFGLQTVRLSAAKTEYAQLQTSIANERAAREKQRADDERQARATEQALAQKAADIQKDSHEKERVLNRRVADLRDQLRNRPERPAPGSASAPAASPDPGHTGAGLYKQDSEFLAGEAATAAAIAIERDACYVQYNAAAEALKKWDSK